MFYLFGVFVVFLMIGLGLSLYRPSPVGIQSSSIDFALTSSAIVGDVTETANIKILMTQDALGVGTNSPFPTQSNEDYARTATSLIGQLTKDKMILDRCGFRSYYTDTYKYTITT